MRHDTAKDSRKQTSSILDAALAYCRAGLSVVPNTTDGDKRPDLPTWDEYKLRPATEAELRGWFGDKPRGIGLVCGRVSGGLELLDFDDEQAGDDWSSMMAEHYPDLLARLTRVRSPRPGLHVWYRVAGMDVPGSCTLARRPATPEELRDKPRLKNRKLVETRGQGAQGVVPGGALAVHKTRRPYVHVGGPGFDALAVVTAAERDVMLSLARSLDRTPPEKVKPPRQPRPRPAGGGDLPGDDFDRRADWHDLLTRNGWRFLFERAGVGYWQRPDKDGPGHSATLGYCKAKDGTPLLRVFSSNADPFEDGKAYGPFRFLVLAEHGGDYSAAARALRPQRESSVPKPPKPAPQRAVAAYQPFPLDALPLPVRQHVEAAAGAIDCDPALVALPAVAAAAGCIGGSYAVQLDHGWIEPSIVWAAGVAESGERKTPAMRSVFDALFTRQADAIRKDDQDAEAWKTWKETKQGEEPAKPRPSPQFLTSNATIEAVAELLADSDRLIVACDELASWFAMMTRYSKGGRNDSTQADWLRLFGNGTFVINRRTGDKRKIVVRSPHVSLYGTIQPAVLQGVLDGQAFESGLAARLLLAMPPRRKHSWKKGRGLDADSAARWRGLCDRLLGLRPRDAANRLPHALPLSPGAERTWAAFYDEWSERQYNAESAEAAALSKLEAYAARLALVHHVVSVVGRGEKVEQDVCQQSVEAGVCLVRWFHGELCRIYSVLRESGDDRRLRRLVELVRQRGGRITASQLRVSNKSRYETTDEAEAALDELVAEGLGTWEEPQPGKAGRPTKTFLLTNADPETQKPQEPE